MFFFTHLQAQLKASKNIKSLKIYLMKFSVYILRKKGTFLQLDFYFDHFLTTCNYLQLCLLCPSFTKSTRCYVQVLYVPLAAFGNDNLLIPSNHNIGRPLFLSFFLSFFVSQYLETLRINCGAL